MDEPDDVPVLLEISEAAHVLSMSAVMVRRYTDQGRLVPAARTRRGVRLYELQSVNEFAVKLGREPRSLE